MLSPNCFVDLSVYCNLSADKVCTWPVASLGQRNDSDDIPDTVIIGTSALYPLAKGAIQMLIIIIIIQGYIFLQMPCLLGRETFQPKTKLG